MGRRRVWQGVLLRREAEEHDESAGCRLQDELCGKQGQDSADLRWFEQDQYVLFGNALTRWILVSRDERVGR